VCSLKRFFWFKKRRFIGSETKGGLHDSLTDLTHVFDIVPHSTTAASLGEEIIIESGSQSRILPLAFGGRYELRDNESFFDSICFRQKNVDSVRFGC
jgi:hypothetical protein